MQTAEIVWVDGNQTVKLPSEIHLDGPTVSIRQVGDAVILEPLKPTAWPAGFFDAIHISDPAFERPPQGTTPPHPVFDSKS